MAKKNEPKEVETEVNDIPVVPEPQEAPEPTEEPRYKPYVWIPNN